MSDTARAKVQEVFASCEHRLTGICRECCEQGLDSYAAEQTAQKDAEIARLTMKVEQYRAQLDDRWAGVVGVTNKHIEQTAGLRAALRKEHRLNCAGPDDPSCEICALLDPEGQASAEGRGAAQA